MDSHDKNESTGRLREEALARRMGEALDRLSPNEIGQCPDAEIVAAYREQALAPEETVQWENHFAACGRCRKILAVLAASVEAPLAESEIVRLGELVHTASRPVQAAPAKEITSIRPRIRDWRARWLAPALGFAAVLAMWFVVRPPWKAKSPEPSGALIAQAKKNEPPAAESRSLDRFSGAETKRKEDSGNSSLASPAAPDAKDRSVMRIVPATPASPPPNRESAANGNAVAEITPSASPAVSAPRDGKQNRNELDRGSAGVSPAPQAQARVATGAPEIAGASGQSAESVTATGEAPPTLAAQPRPNDRVEPPSASNQPAAGQAANVQPIIGRTFQALRKAAVPPGSEIVVRTASGTMLWRAGRQGSIERSSDSGVTWTVQVSPSHEDWLAGSAAADTVCWLAGRNGAIARTADGQHWEKIAPPPASASASGTFPDWIGVAARNAETATLTASDRRQYATEDGGKTWQAQ